MSPCGLAGELETSIIDTLGPGYFEESGVWYTSSLPGYQPGKISRFASSSGAEVRFVKAVTHKTTNRISMHIVVHSTNASLVRAQIGGTSYSVEDIIFNSKDGYTGWMDLGVYEFEAGMNAVVALSRAPGSDLGFVRASAVKYEEIPRTNPIIVDVQTPTYNEKTGLWYSSSLPGYKAGQATRFSPTNGAQGRFFANLPATGTYRISHYNVAHPTNHPLVKAEIEGSSAVIPGIFFDSRQGESGWLELGHYEFTAGDQASVTLTRFPTVGSGFLRTSAMMFELMEIYYVSENGNNQTGTGSYSNPWKRISFAASQVDSGIIHILGGVIWEDKIVHLKPGVSLRGEGRGISEVRSSRPDYLIRLEKSGSQLEDGNQSISGFTLNGLSRSLYGGVMVKGRHNVSIRDMAFKEIYHNAITVTSGTRANQQSLPPEEYLIGLQILDSTFTNCSQAYSGYSSGAIQIGHLDGAEIIGVLIDEDRGYGIKYFDFGWYRNLKISDCQIVVPDERPFPTWKTNFSIELWQLYDDCEISSNYLTAGISLIRGNKGKGTQSVRINHNIFDFGTHPHVGIENSLSDIRVDHNHQEGGYMFFGTNAAGFDLKNHLFHHNSIYDLSHQSGWAKLGYFSDDVDGLKLYNNVVHYTRNDGSQGVASGLLLRNGSFQNVEIKNNIIMNTAGSNGARDLIRLQNGGRASGSWSITNNILYNQKLGNGTGYGVNYNVDPRLVMSGNRPDPYYRSSGLSSPGMNAGVNVGFTFFGSAPDIGAFEVSE